MPAAITDKFRKGAAAFSTTLASQKAASASSMTLSDATGVPTTTAIDFTVGRVDSSGNRTPATKAVYKGTLSGTTVSNLTLVEGTDQLHAAGTPVEITFTAATWNDAIDALLSVIDQDATLKAGAVDVAAVLASDVVTNAKILNGTIELNAKAAPWDGWNAGSGTWTYASATTFTVPAADAAAMSVGTKIKLTQTSAKYFYVTGISGTTITVNGGTDYTVANAAITSPYFSNADAPKDFPHWFTYAPTLANLSGGTQTVARFSMIGRTVHFRFKYTLGGTGVGSAPEFTVPVTMASTYTIDSKIDAVAHYFDVGSTLYTGSISVKSTTTLYFRCIHTDGARATDQVLSSTNPFTFNTGDILEAVGSYEV